MTAREAYSLYVECAVEGANESDGLLSVTCRVGAWVAFVDDEGHRTKVMAAKLNLSLKTAETQLMERLDIHDVAGLVRYAFRVGLIHAWHVRAPHGAPPGPSGFSARPPPHVVSPPRRHTNCTNGP